MSTLIGYDIENPLLYVGINVVVWAAIWAVISAVRGEAMAEGVLPGALGGLLFGVTSFYLQGVTED